MNIYIHAMNFDMYNIRRVKYGIGGLGYSHKNSHSQGHCKTFPYPFKKGKFR